MHEHVDAVTKIHRSLWALFVGVALLLLSAGCGQRWTFAPPGELAVHPVPSSRMAEAETFDRPTTTATPDEPPRFVDRHVAPAGNAWSPSLNPEVVRLPPVLDASPVTPAAAWASNAEEDGPPQLSETCSTESLGWRDRCGGVFGEALTDIRRDHRNYYRWDTACGLLYGVAGASILANTSMDHDVHEWYQDDVRSTETDNFADFWKTFGEGKYFLGAYAGLAVAGKMLDDVPACGTVGEFGMRTTRAYLVGAPPMLLMQYTLGGSRPGETSHDSMWRPFEDNNGVSGHAFIGAVPFMTAARMTDNRLLQAGFYTLSALPAWSRVNDDAHYLSQVCLGWWMAYLACRSVDATEHEDRGLTLAPMIAPNTAGAMLVWRR